MAPVPVDAAYETARLGWALTRLRSLLGADHELVKQDLGPRSPQQAAAALVGGTQLADPAIRLIVLDELNIALRYEHLPLMEVVDALTARREGLHVVVTGRNAKPEMIAAADLVTEMTLVKHHFAAGVKAQEGIEF